MSHKKKTSVLSECTKCSCSVLTKEEAKHRESCNGDGLSDHERSLIIPQLVLRGTLQHLADVSGDLPENTFGWLKGSVMLVHPVTLRALDVQPRHPVTVHFESGAVQTALLWPSQQVSPLRCWLRDGPKEQKVEVRVVNDVLTRNRLQLSILSGEKGNAPGSQVADALQQFLQAYLRGAFILADAPLSIGYCGKTVIVQPVEGQATAIEDALRGMSLGDGGDVASDSSSPPRVLHITATCSISLTNGATTKEEKKNGQDLTFDSIPGMVETKRSLHELVITPATAGLSPCSTLLYGVPGSGKTLLLEALGRLLGATIVRGVPELIEVAPLLGSSTTPCVLIADINELPVDKEHAVYRLIPETIARGVTMVLGVRSADDVPLAIRVRFAAELEAGVPSEIERAAILRYLAPTLTDVQAEDMARLTHAFTGSDLASLVHIAACDHTQKDTVVALQSARKRVRPTGLRQFALEVPTVCWADIAGNEQLKLEIEQAVIWPLTNRDAFARFGVAAPSGILLYGPPGCSKTLIARALAHESKMNFISVKGPELFSKWVGDSEKAIRQLFARARQVAPSIVFFDEIDAVGATRGAGSSGGGVNERVLAQLLTELDGLESNEGVVLLAATNRPDQLDSALLRPGRLDRALYVPLPTDDTRGALLRLRAKKIPFSSEVDIDSLVHRTIGYSGAELVAVCQTAALAAMRDPEGTNEVHTRHFDSALIAVRPRTDRTMLHMYEKFAAGGLD